MNNLLFFFALCVCSLVSCTDSTDRITKVQTVHDYAVSVTSPKVFVGYTFTTEMIHVSDAKRNINEFCKVTKKGKFYFATCKGFTYKIKVSGVIEIEVLQNEKLVAVEMYQNKMR